MNCDLLAHLELIGSINPGFTLDVVNLNTMKHQSLWCSARRTWYQQTRDSTVSFIEKKIDVAIPLLSSDLSIYPVLRKTLQGLTSLKITYKTDAFICERIDACSRRVENACTRFQRRIITSIEQIPSLIQASYEEFENCLIHQTPVPSAPESSKHTPLQTPGPTPKRSPFLTPSKTPLRTPIRTPYRSPTRSWPNRGDAPTPPSSPNRLPNRTEPSTPPSSPNRQRNVPSDYYTIGFDSPIGIQLWVPFLFRSKKTLAAKTTSSGGQRELPSSSQCTIRIEGVD